MSAADRPSEYLKRTCLICGCNTNQTINIYEPRSGPNIVELIQAKFKFQPLNEDKYLCFSCNNWLINWHSLQANNSNDAESPSGTFRSSQVNGGMAHEKRVPLQQQQKHSTPTANRPVAQVRPRQLIEATVECQPKPDAISPESSVTVVAKTSSNSDHTDGISTVISTAQEFTKQNYAKRSIRKTHGLRRGCKKHLSQCCVCGRNIIFYIRGSVCGKLRQFSAARRSAKCRKCRSVCQWRAIHLRSITKERIKSINSIQNRPPQSEHSLVSRIDEGSSESPRASINQSQYLKRPLVDGKVVAMLRRLGTTLSREENTANNNNNNNSSSSSSAQQLPPIMSPTKPKPRWTRPLEADEVLLNFETAISEVLPILENTSASLTTEPTTTTTTTEAKTTTSAAKQRQTRRKLKYQMTCGSENEVVQSEYIPAEYEDIFNSLPKGLDISLV